MPPLPYLAKYYVPKSVKATCYLADTNMIKYQIINMLS